MERIQEIIDKISSASTEHEIKKEEVAKVLQLIHQSSKENAIQINKREQLSSHLINLVGSSYYYLDILLNHNQLTEIVEGVLTLVLCNTQEEQVLIFFPKGRYVPCKEFFLPAKSAVEVSVRKKGEESYWLMSEFMFLNQEEEESPYGD